MTKSELVTIPTFYSCLNVLANTVAKMPTQVFKKTKSGKEKVDNDVSYLLSTRPNPHMTPFTFKHTRMVQQVIYGNSYTWIESIGGKVVALWLLNAKYMEVKKINNKIFYIYTEDMTPVVFNSEEIIHTKQLSEDGISGKSILSILLETTGNIKAANKLFGTYFKNGSLSNLAVEVPDPMGVEARNSMRDDIMEGQSGVDNANKLMIVAGGGVLKEVNSNKFVDQQLLESLKLNDEQIARALNVPLAMVGIMTGATFSNTEQQSLNFITNTIQPPITQWEEEEAYKLFAAYIRDQGYYVKYNMASALRADNAGRAAFYTAMCNLGAYSIDDVRELEDKNPLPNGVGNKYRADLNHVNIEIIDEYQLGKANASKGSDPNK